MYAKASRSLSAVARLGKRQSRISAAQSTFWPLTPECPSPSGTRKIGAHVGCMSALAWYELTSPSGNTRNSHTTPHFQPLPNR
jgi:hypothetical protein